MLDDSTPITERLYLSKGTGTDIIYIDCVLEQHQIDTIRCLYTQFKKKNPGVIFSDPSESQKSVQLPLFLEAINCVLKKPIIIFCQESELPNWVEFFRKWTKVSDEIAIKHTNPFANKTIFINPSKDMKNMCRNHWGVMVIDDEQVKLKNVITKADYKIWISSADMMLQENIKYFWSLYKWLYPDVEFFKLEDFCISNGDSAKDALNKTILLDTLQQDILVRCPLPKTYKPQHVNYLPNDLNKKKNKDSTGRFTKGTKRKLENTNTSSASLMKHNESNDNKLKINIKNVNESESMNETEESEISLLSSHYRNCDVKSTRFSNEIFKAVKSLGINSDENSQVLNRNNKPQTATVTEDSTSVTDITGNPIYAVCGDKKKISNEEDELFLESNPMGVNKSSKQKVQDEIQEMDVSTVENNQLNETGGHNVSKCDIDNIDARFNEFEAKIMSKFKGSLLDKMF